MRCRDVLRRQDTLSSTLFSISNGSLWRHAAFSPTRCAIHSNSANCELDPFNYTTGRWLRRDAQERAARCIRFDFDALCRRVVALCPGATAVTGYSKKEGGFNRIFVFHTDNAKRVVARLPFAVAGPRRLTTASEVATIRFLQEKTNIPIPKILDWSDDASNAIGAEYIIMEHAPGISLSEKWPSMGVGEQIRCIEAIFQTLKELDDMQFPAYGSLYFADTRYIAGRSLPFTHDFCIGPHCGVMYWDCSVGQARYGRDDDANQGPWRHLPAYSDALIDTGLARLPATDAALQQRPRYHGSVQTHRQILEQGRTVLSKIAVDARVTNAATPMLFHPDLHKRNIFVSEADPTIVTAILDWQASSIEPSFSYADSTPDFAQPAPDPAKSERIEPKSEACAGAFDACIQFLVPKLRTARAIDEGLIRPFRYAHRTWNDGAVAFREELIQTSLHWKELGLAGTCPFAQPCADELAQHQRDYRRFEAAHQLRHAVSQLLNTASDGWVPADAWAATERAHRELFFGMRAAVVGNEMPEDDEPIRSEDELREIWPFDLHV
ncbi:hypothetical protein ACJQWK_08047 [Exserohilum turcicum]